MFLRVFSNPLSFSSESQLWFSKEGAKESLLALGNLERITDQIIKFSDIIGSTVVEPGMFAVTPELFNGIKLGSVRRKPFDADTVFVFGEESFKPSGFVYTPVVHDNDNPARDSFLEAFDEGENLRMFDIMLVELKAKVNPSAVRGYTDSADCRDVVMLLRLDMEWGFAFRSPAFTQKPLQHKAGFVKEDDVFFSPSWLVFLSSASLPCATLEPVADFAPWPFVPASDSSSPSAALSAISAWYRNECQNASRLPCLSFLVSRADLSTRGFELPAEAAEPAGFFEPKTAENDGGDEVEPLETSSLPFSPSLSSAERTKPTILPLRQPPAGLIPALTAPLPGVFSLPVPWGFLWVSYILLYTIFCTFGRGNVNSI